MCSGLPDLITLRVSRSISKSHRQSTPPSESHRQSTPPSESHRQSTPPSESHRQSMPPSESHRQSAAAQPTACEVIDLDSWIGHGWRDIIEMRDRFTGSVGAFTESMGANGGVSNGASGGSSTRKRVRGWGRGRAFVSFEEDDFDLLGAPLSAASSGSGIGSGSGFEGEGDGGEGEGKGEGEQGNEHTSPTDFMSSRLTYKNPFEVISEH